MINNLVHVARVGVLAGCLVALGPLTAVGAPQADGAAAQGCDKDSRHEHGFPGPGGGPHFGPGGPGGPGHFGPPPHGFGPPEFGPDFGVRPPPYLHELKLTDEQQDKVFNIVHAAEPGMRDAGKAAHKAHDALRDVGSSAQFDEKSVAALVQAQAKADSQVMLLRIKTEHDIYSILTPEQRAKVADIKKEHEAHMHDGPPR